MQYFMSTLNSIQLLASYATSSESESESEEEKEDEEKGVCEKPSLQVDESQEQEGADTNNDLPAPDFNSLTSTVSHQV